MYYPRLLVEAELSIFNLIFCVGNNFFLKANNKNKGLLSMPNHKLSKNVCHKKMDSLG